MRVALSIGLVASALIASAFIAAQPRDAGKKAGAKEPATLPVQPRVAEKKTPVTKPAGALTSRAVLARLQTEVDTKPFQEPIKFKEFVRIISEQLEASDRAVSINVDVESFMQIAPDLPDPQEEFVVITGNRKRGTVVDLLSQAVKRIGGGGGATFVIRAGRVDIIPLVHSSKEFTFNQTFHADFKDQRLDLALEEISDLTGVSIVIDARARQKAQTMVTARFNDDVAMQDAVRMLADMGDLKIVYLVTGMYLTTPERAAVMQKELRQLYEGEPIPMPPALGPMPPGINPMMPNPFFDPQTSPLTPPLPRGLKGRRLEAAA